MTRPDKIILHELQGGSFVVIDTRTKSGGYRGEQLCPPMGRAEAERVRDAAVKESGR